MKSEISNLKCRFDRTGLAALCERILSLIVAAPGSHSRRPAPIACPTKSRRTKSGREAIVLSSFSLRPAAYGLPLLLLLFITGCARFRTPPVPVPPAPPEVSDLAPSDSIVSGNLRVTSQYWAPVTPRVGYNTLAIYIENLGEKTVTFKGAEYDGMSLPLAKPSNVKLKAFDTMEFDGMKIPLKTEIPAKKDLVWWEYYPCPMVRPGETAAFQVNFRKSPSTRHTIRLLPKGLDPVEVPVPRFRDPEKSITAITYTCDYSRMFVQYDARNAKPEQVWVNNYPVTDFRVLESPEPRTPNMLAFAPPFPLVTSMPLHVKIRFSDNNWRQALVRALNTISVQAPFSVEKTPEEVEELGIDPDPDVINPPADVVCTDVRRGEKGFSAADFIEKRVRAYRENPTKLAGVDYCTAMFPECWNIYGAIADCVYSKPYRLNWGHNATRFIEEEEECMIKAYLSSRPRPFLYITEAYDKRGRFIEPEELKINTWMAIALGAKGIRHHFWKWRRHVDSGFLDCESLHTAVAELDKMVQSRRSRISAAANISSHALQLNGRGSPSIKAKGEGFVKLYTSWTGDTGILLMLRNMNYKTENRPNDHGRKPVFSVAPVEKTIVSIPCPTWFKPGTATDLLSDKKIKTNLGKDNTLNLETGALNAYQLVWIENKNTR